jgi:hypothetical protein
VSQYDLLGWELEHTRIGADGAPYATRGRCVGAWGDSEWLNLALAGEDGEVSLVSLAAGDRLRILPGRKVPLA